MIDHQEPEVDQVMQYKGPGGDIRDWVFFLKGPLGRETHLIMA
jgi:hypothetical protein